MSAMAKAIIAISWIGSAAYVTLAWNDQSNPVTIDLADTR